MRLYKDNFLEKYTNYWKIVKTVKILQTFNYFIYARSYHSSPTWYVVLRRSIVNHQLIEVFWWLKITYRVFFVSIKIMIILKPVLVITCLGGRFWINCPNAFLTIFKNHDGDLSQKSPELNMWLLVNHTKPTLCVETNIFQQGAIIDQRAGNYKITPLSLNFKLLDLS